MAKTFIEACLPAVLSFFIGPWSDSNGRKPFLLSSVSGYVISYTIWGILAQFDTIPAIYFLLVTIPTCISGGAVAFFTSAFCYIGDVSTEKNRGLRYCLLFLFKRKN
ncbi:hypothetical protein AAG570_006425 [Ranatra chinensis]|uniref:Uncharacterized protein n=1 Tax=Ranatra chinensis TaxID=642074 RepID=A0ABD0YU13_9HEMI